MQKRPVSESSAVTLVKRPHLESRIGTHPGGKKSAGGSVSVSSADARKKFCNFLQFNVEVAAAHHPIIQKEVDELLAKVAVEPSSGGTCFYSSVFVAPKCTVSL